VSESIGEPSRQEKHNPAEAGLCMFRQFVVRLQIAAAT